MPLGFLLLLLHSAELGDGDRGPPLGFCVLHFLWRLIHRAFILLFRSRRRQARFAGEVVVEIRIVEYILHAAIIYNLQVLRLLRISLVVLRFLALRLFNRNVALFITLH